MAAENREKKSPLNEIVGRLVQYLREYPGASEEATAKALELSRSYLRVVELGNRCLPAYSVPGLHELGLDFQNASALVAIVQYLDQREEKGGAYDLDKILDRIVSIRPMVPQPLEIILNSVVKTISEIRDGHEVDRSYRETPFIAQVAQALRKAPKSPDARPAERQLSAAMPIRRLSPIMEDIVRGLVTQLSLFPPHTNVESISEWEKLNSRRIAGVTGYVDDAEKLLDGEDKFDWTFLSNPDKPVVTIYLPSNIKRADTVQRVLRDRLRRRVTKRSGGTDNTKNVVVKVLPKEIQSECDHFLFFDFFTRGPLGRGAAVKSSGTNDLQLKQASGAVRKFNDVWLYKIRPDVLQPNADPHLVGVLAAYHEHGPKGVYVVVMDHQHTTKWSEIFARAGK